MPLSHSSGGNLIRVTLQPEHNHFDEAAASLASLFIITQCLTSVRWSWWHQLSPWCGAEQSRLRWSCRCRRSRCLWSRRAPRCSGDRAAWPECQWYVLKQRTDMKELIQNKLGEKKDTFTKELNFINLTFPLLWSLYLCLRAPPASCSTHCGRCWPRWGCRLHHIHTSWWCLSSPGWRRQQVYPHELWRSCIGRCRSLSPPADRDINLNQTAQVQFLKLSSSHRDVEGSM